MDITKTMRLKYINRRAHGRGDVLRLCDLVDSLEQLVRDIQRKLPVEDQNEIERKLWYC